MMAARHELSVSAGLICVKFDLKKLLRTTELWTSARLGMGLYQMHKADKGRRCKSYTFADILDG